jgi:hypothetical protein
MAFDIDKEVQDFGPYQLVIRQPKGAKAYALLWRGGEKLAMAEGDTREAAYDEMQRLLGIQQLEKAKALGAGAPQPEQVATAFRFLWQHMHDKQQAMLKALYKHRELSATQLAEAAPYRSYSAANLWLGVAGAMFAQECPRGDLLQNSDESPVATSWFCTWNEGPRTWSLRPEVAEGMRLAHCVG